MKLVEVVWNDANFEDEYGTRDSKDLGPVRLHTAGYLAAETDEALIIAMTICKDDNKVVTEQIVIPWGMIVDYWLLHE